MDDRASTLLLLCLFYRQKYQNPNQERSRNTLWSHSLQVMDEARGPYEQQVRKNIFDLYLNYHNLILIKAWTNLDNPTKRFSLMILHILQVSSLLLKAQKSRLWWGKRPGISSPVVSLRYHSLRQKKVTLVQSSINFWPVPRIFHILKLTLKISLSDVL